MLRQSVPRAVMRCSRHAPFERTFRYSGLRPIESLKAAIDAVDPDIVVPSCDRSVEHLHELYELEKSRGAAGSKISCAHRAFAGIARELSDRVVP